MCGGIGLWLLDYIPKFTDPASLEGSCRPYSSCICKEVTCKWSCVEGLKTWGLTTKLGQAPTTSTLNSYPTWTNPGVVTKHNIFSACFFHKSWAPSLGLSEVTASLFQWAWFVTMNKKIRKKCVSRHTWTSPIPEPVALNFTSRVSAGRILLFRIVACDESIFKLWKSGYTNQ